MKERCNISVKVWYICKMYHSLQWKCRNSFQCARCISGITFIRCSQIWDYKWFIFLRVWQSQPETVNRRSPDNKMAKWKWTKGQTMIYQTLNIKHQTIRTPIKPWGKLGCCGRVSSSYSTCGQTRVLRKGKQFLLRMWAN
jgi:hypothetical protein